jgi:succinate-acetate transporter protein
MWETKYVKILELIQSLLARIYWLTRRFDGQGPLVQAGFGSTLLAVILVTGGLDSVSVQTIQVANLCFIACTGLLIVGQWERTKGNAFSYSVLSAFGMSPIHPPLPTLCSTQAGY